MSYDKTLIVVDNSLLLSRMRFDKAGSCISSPSKDLCITLIRNGIYGQLSGK